MDQAMGEACLARKHQPRTRYPAPAAERIPWGRSRRAVDTFHRKVDVLGAGMTRLLVERDGRAKRTAGSRSRRRGASDARAPARNGQPVLRTLDPIPGMSALLFGRAARPRGRLTSPADIPHAP